MEVSALGTQVEKLSRATRALMSLTGSPQERLTSALTELSLGFLENEAVNGVAETELGRLRSLVSGPGTWSEIVGRLDETKLEQVADAFSRLDRAVIHAYYRAMTAKD